MKNSKNPLDYFEPLPLIVGATRYYLGRQTIAVHAFTQHLIVAWPYIPIEIRNILIRDIEEEFRIDDLAREEGNRIQWLGDNCDRASWEKVRALWKGK